MKKISSCFFILAFLAGFANASDFRIEARAQYFQPREQAFRDIYGSGPQFGGEFSIGLWRGLEIWLGGSYFAKKGLTTFAQEEIRIRIIPLGGGLKYGFLVGSFNLYAGLGIQYFKYKETAIPEGDHITEAKIGYVARLGSMVDLARPLILDFFLEYNICQMKPADFELDIGGLSFGIGLGWEF
jgi:hypothetical protein